MSRERKTYRRTMWHVSPHQVSRFDSTVSIQILCSGEVCVPRVVALNMVSRLLRASRVAAV